MNVPPRPADLPDFERPPIDEVVLGLEFAPLPNFSQAQLGGLWNEIRDEYPLIQNQPLLIEAGPLPMMIPPLGLGSSAGSRTWFVSHDDSYILQVQHDRLLHNWRKRIGEYPRFEPLFERFHEHLNRFQRVMSEVGLGPILPRQVEVTYINWVTDMQPPEFCRPAQLPEPSAVELSRVPTQQQWVARYAVRVANRPEGALTINLAPGIKPPPPVPQLGHQLLLTFKVPVSSEEGLGELMALGRDIIVRTFTDITTQHAHQQWGLR